MAKNGDKAKSKKRRAPNASEYNSTDHHKNSKLNVVRNDQNPINKQQNMNNPNNKKGRHSFTRIAVDPSKKYHQPESRESWGPNVKGKKFKKEKGKKKRCPNAGFKIDGTVNSIKF